MTTKIIHICEDEKFINSAIQQFESCFPSSNIFYVLPLSEDCKEFLHVKPQLCVQMINQDFMLKIARSVENSVLIVLHSLSPKFYDFVLQLPLTNKVIWFCYGFEVYNDTNYFKRNILLDTITAIKFPVETKTLKQTIVEFIIKCYRIIRPSLSFSKSEKKKQVFNRVTFIGTSFIEEYKSISKLLKIKKPYFNFWYYPLENILDVSIPINLNKKSILIGNSGHKTGNHLDVFAKIKSYTLITERIVVPLNYGDEAYIKAVNEEGMKHFSDKFNAFHHFITLEKYNAVLNEVGVAILNNRRQQAFGNTIALLWMGAKVFLSKQNPIYSFFKRIDVYVYCYETELDEQSCNQYLSLKEIKHNRKVLFDVLNREKLAFELFEQISKVIIK